MRVSRILFRSATLVVTVATSVAAQNNLALGTPGIISGISATPATAHVYQPVILSVAGAGECGQVMVTFGDGKDTTFSNVKFPRDAQHMYSKAGRYVIGARPISGCNSARPILGSVSVEGSAVDLLCALTGCEGPTIGRTDPCAKPNIKNVSYTKPLEPTKELIIYGCGFGGGTSGHDGTRVVRLKGAFPSPGTSVSLQVITWTDGAIHAKVPALTGVKDQTAQLQIESEPNSSNQVPVDFRATREITFLRMFGPTAATTMCSENAQFNKCVLDSDFIGYHVNPTKNPFIGADRISFSLANGWLIDGIGRVAEFWAIVLDDDHPQFWMLKEADFATFDKSEMPVGSPGGQLKIVWSTPAETYSRYTARFRVKGPIGVPMQ